MGLGFVNLEIALNLKSTDGEALRVLEEIKQLGSAGDLFISTQIHVTRANVEALVEKFERLEELAVVKNTQSTETAGRLNQYQVLKDSYLRYKK